MNATNGLAIESRSLEQLKQEAARDPKSAVRKAATQFEAMFLQMVLKSMRDATMQSGLTQDSSQQTFTTMLDSQLAQKMAGRGMGLADALTRQMSRQMKFDPENSGPLELKPLNRPSAAPLSGMPQISLERLRAQLGSSAPPGAPPGTAASVGAPTPGPMPSTANLSASQRSFVQGLWEPALAAERSTGVPASFIIGQAALETGWGKHQIRDAQGNPSFNLFGIKAGSSWNGPSVSATTTEYKDGNRMKVVEKFRAYSLTRSHSRIGPD